MIKISSEIKKEQNNFWNHCHFHPTDAIEDPWGKRILDRISNDKSIDTVRMYAMLEDIVYEDYDGKLCYDYRINDLRMDYMIEKGFNILLSYNFMPECIATDKTSTSTVCKNKTRYKGKVINTSTPKSYELWEEVCYNYTKHIVDRYGIETVSKWHLQCFNEPDLSLFFMSHLGDKEEDVIVRAYEYMKMYSAFEKALRRVSEKLCMGGPALAYNKLFLGMFLDYVKENNLRLDFISLHNYGAQPADLTNKTAQLDVSNNVEKQKGYAEVIKEHGFSDKEIILCEWGATTSGFFNRDEAPELMFRETEVFASYYIKLIHEFIKEGFAMSKMIICLSGQHEMTEDFTGFRNFFTLNFIAKPIYNAYILASRLGKKLLYEGHENENLFVIPTKKDNGDYSVIMTYAKNNFDEDIPTTTETIGFDEDIKGKTVTVYCIDKNTTNPYRLYQRENMSTPTREQILMLREEGNLKPISQFVFDGNGEIKLCLSPNATILITVEDK